MWARGPALCKSLCAVRWGPDKSGTPGNLERDQNRIKKRGKMCRRGFRIVAQLVPLTWALHPASCAAQNGG